MSARLTGGMAGRQTAANAEEVTAASCGAVQFPCRAEVCKCLTHSCRFFDLCQCAALRALTRPTIVRSMEEDSERALTFGYLLRPGERWAARSDRWRFERVAGSRTTPSLAASGLFCRTRGGVRCQIQLHAAGSPHGHTGAEEVGVRRPHGAAQHHGARQRRPVFGVAFTNARQGLLLQRLI